MFNKNYAYNNLFKKNKQINICHILFYLSDLYLYNKKVLKLKLIKKYT